MLSPSAMFCTMLEQQYAAIVAQIDLLIQFPATALSMLNSNISRLFAVTYNVIEAAILALEQQLLNILGLDDIDQGNVSSWCSIAQECEALIDLLVDSGLLASILPSGVSVSDVLNNYEKWEKYVCKDGLGDLIDGWIDDALQTIYDQIMSLRDRLLGALGIDELIDKYLQAVEESGIYDLLDQLDKFAQCAFEICDYVSTASNSSEDTLERLSMEKQGAGYVFVTTPLIESVYAKDEELNTRLDDMERLIQDYLGGTNNKPEGVSPDESMKL